MRGRGGRETDAFLDIPPIAPGYGMPPRSPSPDPMRPTVGWWKIPRTIVLAYREELMRRTIVATIVRLINSSRYANTIVRGIFHHPTVGRIGSGDGERGGIPYPGAMGGMSRNASVSRPPRPLIGIHRMTFLAC